MSNQSFEVAAAFKARSAFRIPEVAARSGLSTRTVWKEIATGKLAAHKVGRATLILADEERRWIEGLPSK